MRTAINAIVIQDSSLLVVRKKFSWILPGGKPEKGEGDLECLCREIWEELSGTKIKDMSFYGTFEGRTPHKGDIIIANTYFANINGRIYGVRGGDSISEVTWTKDFGRYNLSDITFKIVNSLQKDNYL